MKNLFCLILVSLSFYINVEAQVTWQKLYNGPFDFEDVCRDLCYSDNGNFFAVGYSQQTGFAGSNIYVLKLKPNGDTIWTRVLGQRSNQYANTCASSGDGGCVISGSSDSASTTKINKDGQIIWRKYYGNSSVQIFDISKTSDGGYIACGLLINSTYNGYVFKIDSLGNLEWKKVFPSNSNKVYYSVIQYNDQYILAGLSNDSELSPISGVVLKLTSNGDIIWEKKYIYNNFTSFKKILPINNGYLLCGNTYDSLHVHSQIFISKMDTAGKLNYLKTIDYYDNEYLYDVSINNNTYVFAGDTDTLTGRNARIYITDTLGNVQHTKIFNLSDYTLLRSILPTSNGDLLFGGTSDTHSNTFRDVYIVRTDSTLFCKPLNINPYTSIVNDFKLYQNYPNPFNPTTTIKFELRKKSFVNIKVFDISGKKIRTLIKDNLNNGSYEIFFDGKELPSGIYLCQFFLNNVFADSKKMILIK